MSSTEKRTQYFDTSLTCWEGRKWLEQYLKYNKLSISISYYYCWYSCCSYFEDDLGLNYHLLFSSLVSCFTKQCLFFGGCFSMFQPYALSHDLVMDTVSLYLVCILCMYLQVYFFILLFHFTIGEISLYFLTFCFRDDDQHFLKVCLILRGQRLLFSLRL